MGAESNLVLTVVVTYNRKNLLRQNLECLLAQDGASCDILVVDNASTDGTEAMIAEDFNLPQISYFNTGANLGGAGGFHLGLYWAAMSDYDYVWIMDDDSLPSPTALKELLDAGESLGDWGFLSSAVYWTDGSLCMANRPKRDLFRHIGCGDLEGGPKPVRMGSFVSMLVPTTVIREVGLPIAEYFIWTDDYEFSGRISKLHPCYFVPASKVTHAMASNTRADLVTADGERAKRFRMLYRNDMHCYRQHGVEGWAYLASKGAYTALNVALHAKTDKAARIDAMLAGYRDGLLFSPQLVSGDLLRSKAVSSEGAKPTKVLIYTDGWGRGGIEAFVMEALRNIDLEEFDISIFSPWDDGEDCFGDELRKLGVERRCIQSGERPSNIKRGVLDTSKFTEMYDLTQYDVLHANTTTVVGLQYCKAAKLAGVRRVIAHSHNSAFGSGWELVKGAIHQGGRAYLNRFVDKRVACSVPAGDYLFGDREYEIVKNGIDINRFRFNEAVRRRVRNELGIPQDAFVVGNIGRLAEEKNPFFQIEVFTRLLEIRPDAYYVMVGSGPLEEDVRRKVEELGISGSVRMLPATPSPEDYYSALDVFLFPSIFEGLPITTIEAQCSGLYVLASAHLTKEIRVTDLVSLLDLDDGFGVWAKELLTFADQNHNRLQYARVLDSEGWSARSAMHAISALYNERTPSSDIRIRER